MGRMHLRTRPSLAWALGVAAICGLSAVASGQQLRQPAPPDLENAADGMAISGPRPLQLALPPEGRPASFESEPSVGAVPSPPPPPPPPEAPSADLAQRVADLEKRLADLSQQGAGAEDETSDKPLIFPSGRIQIDAAGFTQNGASRSQFGNVRDAVGFRRARLAVLGEYERLDYIVEMDFANRGADALINSRDQSVAFKNVYIQLREFPLFGTVRIGHFKECFGLEQMTSDSYGTFMERSTTGEGAFVPGRNNGIMAFDWSENERLTWGIGAFTNQTGFDQPPVAQFDHWGVDATGRLTYLAWYDEPSGGRGVLHTGLDYAYRSAADDTAIFATRPEAAFGPAVVNLRLTDVDHWQVMAAEGALTYGSLSLQSEFFAAAVDRVSGDTNNFFGAYAFVSYFLTGEFRPYNRKLGVFDRVIPYENFLRPHTGNGDRRIGTGAWEIAYRFSYVDIRDDLTAAGAGRVADHTIGLNWYWNPYTRLMFNYVHSLDTYNVTDAASVSGGTVDAFTVRLAMDF